MEDMYPQKPEVAPTQTKQAAWLEKAKQTIQGEKKVIPFNFTPEVCMFLPLFHFILDISIPVLCQTQQHRVRT